MRSFKDDRGISYNDVFPSVNNGDINISIVYPWTIKAFHRHKLQDDHWMVIKGNIKVALFDEALGGILNIHYLSEGEFLHIPKEVWHGLQVLGNEEVIMIYHITEKYNEDNPDEERAPWNKFYNWEISRK